MCTLYSIGKAGYVYTVQCTLYSIGKDGYVYTVQYRKGWNVYTVQYRKGWICVHCTVQYRKGWRLEATVLALRFTPASIL